MVERGLFPLILIAGASVVGSAAGSAGQQRLEERVAAIHRDAIVVDGHNDVAMWIMDFGFDLGMDGWEPNDRWGWMHLAMPWLPGRPGADQVRTHTDLRRMSAGGLDAQFFSVWVSPEYYDVDSPVPGSAFARANAVIDGLESQAKRHAERIEMAFTSADVRRIASTGKVAMLLGLEGGYAIEDDLNNLREFYGRGIRYMTLTWSFSQTWADSSGDPLHSPEVLHHGLTEFGRQVVREMNDLGMLVDVSHVSDDTFWDTLEVARAPVIASHSSCRNLVPNARNLSDDMLRALAANEGVVMINFSVLYLDSRKTTPWRFVSDWVSHLGRSETSVSHVADHIDHAVRVAGVEHVGLGSDYDGAPFVPMGLEHVGKLPNLTLELVRRGYSDDDLRKILGENLLRVLSQAEELATRNAAARRPTPVRPPPVNG
jgi:membrane dipeptidase